MTHKFIFFSLKIEERKCRNYFTIYHFSFFQIHYLNSVTQRPFSLLSEQTTRVIQLSPAHSQVLIGVTAQIHTLFIFYTEWMAGSGPSPARAIVWQNGPGPIAELWNFHPNFFFDGFALLTECVGWFGHTVSEIFLNGSHRKDTKSASILAVKLRVGRVDLGGWSCRHPEPAVLSSEIAAAELYTAMLPAWDSASQPPPPLFFLLLAWRDAPPHKCVYSPKVPLAQSAYSFSVLVEGIARTCKLCCLTKQYSRGYLTE